MIYRDELGAAKLRAEQLSEQVETMKVEAERNENLSELMEQLTAQLAQARETEATMKKIIKDDLHGGAAETKANLTQPLKASIATNTDTGRKKETHFRVYGLGAAVMLSTGIAYLFFSTEPHPEELAEQPETIAINKEKAAELPSAPAIPSTEPLVVDAPPTQDELILQAKRAVCRNLLSCYTKHEAWGPVSIDVTAQIKSDGSVGIVKMGGTPPLKVHLCLAKRVKARRLENYSLGPATARCITVGTLTPSARMINRDAQFRLKSPPRPASPCMPGDPLCVPSAI